ncbi:trypsin-like peptidase domain-containing protein [Streptomyces sp. NPDC020898]|uniref:S1C family serine protease n=1 Tax=Streptomyces sp. NPDC020898 TaxID=3365101 RepID=UPI00378D0664
MNEGKPAKAKWWSRPRGAGTPGQETPASGEGSVGGGVGGDFELERPRAVPGRADGGDRDGDGDFELAVPEAAGRDRDGTGESEDRDEGTDADGDFELPLPVAVPGLAPAPEFSGRGDSANAAAVAGVGGGKSADGIEDAVPDALAVEPPQSLQAPQPLHDPDPYSTPPYGHPGPWAPAPPVQHPAVTPTHGTAVPGPPAPQGVLSDVPGADGPQETPQDASQAPPGFPQAPSGLPPAPPPYGVPATATAPVSDVPPPESPAGPDPWRRYDPWAAPAPLQQSGAALAGGPGGRPRTRKRGLVVGAVLLALLSGGVGGAVGSYLERNGAGGDSVQLPQAESDESVGRAPDSVAGIAARALPSVVTLHVRGADAQGTGTGFVLDGRGHILTNNHVVEPAGGDGEITVTFSGGETAEAEIVGRDSGYDLAVVKVSGVGGLRPVVLGNSDDVRVGDPVVAIGAPFDLANTVTSGIISAKERPITAGGGDADGSDVSYVDALQTDAPINPGNSGGPLLDARARVVGINSAIRSADMGSGLEGTQSGSIGLGFAIPINQGKRVAEELINTGRATHPVIGVTLDMDYTGDGARVGTESNDGGPAVTAGGPGDRAGLESGDVITEVDGRRVHSGEELIVKIRAHRPGDRLEMSLERGGLERTVTLVLGSSGGN